MLSRIGPKWKSLADWKYVSHGWAVIPPQPLASSLAVLTADDRICTGPGPFSLVVAGLALGAGLSIACFDDSASHYAHCEGASVVINNQLPPCKFDKLHHSIQHFSDWMRRRIFFMYERRIRAYSSPQKVFEYFASIKESKDRYYMTPGDLMRAIIPVLPPSESTIVRAGYLIGERIPGELQCPPSKFFMMFDMNADGRISFHEYNFIRTLIMTSLESFFATFKMFDRNGDGTIEMKEFIKVMHMMREQNKEIFAQRGVFWSTQRSLDAAKDSGLLKHLFGEKGDRLLQYEDFVVFLDQLHDEILQLEFSHYDCKQQGSIPAQDFASSMVAAASMSRINKYLKRVDALANDETFKGIRITFKDFQQFSELRRKRKLLALSAFAVGGIKGFSKEDFKWAASQVCQVDLSDTAIDVIFFVFDSNGDGKLSLNEFLGVQDLREVGLVDPLQPGIVQFGRCMLRCTRGNCNQDTR